MIKVIKNCSDNIDIIQMKNDDLEIQVTNYGATIMKVLMKDKQGNIDDVILGYEEVDGYQKKDGYYFGSVVGRVCNRIGYGQFKLNDKDFQLETNSGKHHLHGGKNGFSYQIFDYTIDNDKIIFHYVSKDGEEGYPGNLDFNMIYELKGDTLIIYYQATSDKDTIVNFTNHMYFNLSGVKENIENHLLQIHADYYIARDESDLATGAFIDLNNTAFDFKEPILIKKNIHKNDVQLTSAKGYDHSFVFNQNKNQVRLIHEKTGRELIVSTSLPQAHIYSANFVSNTLGKYNIVYNERDGICIETQFMPNSINLEKEPKVILRKGQLYEQYTSYKFRVI